MFLHVSRVYKHPMAAPGAMLVVLVAVATAAPVPQIAVYSECKFTLDSAGYCPLLVSVGEHNPYCCAERPFPGPLEVPVLGVECYDVYKAATPCPIIVTAGPAAWCCGQAEPFADNAYTGIYRQDDDWLGLNMGRYGSSYYA